jgi:hypothetical protein
MQTLSYGPIRAVTVSTTCLVIEATRCHNVLALHRAQARRCAACFRLCWRSAGVQEQPEDTTHDVLFKIGVVADIQYADVSAVQHSSAPALRARVNAHADVRPAQRMRAHGRPAALTPPPPTGRWRMPRRSTASPASTGTA